MNVKSNEHKAPTLEEVRLTAARLAPYIRMTPTFHWSGDTVASRLGADTELFLKLELFQRTGTFKVRGAVNNALDLSDDQLARGITAMSSGKPRHCRCLCGPLRQHQRKSGYAGQRQPGPH